MWRPASTSRWICRGSENKDFFIVFLNRLTLNSASARKQTSGGFGPRHRRGLLWFCLLRVTARSVLLLPVFTWQEIMDGSFYVWSESVVHLGVHDLSDDPVHTRLQHTRSKRKNMRLNCISLSFGLLTWQNKSFLAWTANNGLTNGTMWRPLKMWVNFSRASDWFVLSRLL